MLDISKIEADRLSIEKAACAPAQIVLEVLSLLRPRAIEKQLHLQVNFRTPIPKMIQERAMDAAECIQCGACVAQCPNGAGQLFTAAKVSHLGLLPQGQPERYDRVLKMVDVMEEYFGSCTMFRECEAVCPKGISVDFIARMNRDYIVAKLKDRKAAVNE